MQQLADKQTISQKGGHQNLIHNQNMKKNL